MSKICYFCDEDGDFVKAVAEYTAKDDEIYAVCPKHLKDVKKAKLDYWIIDEDYKEDEEIGEKR